MLKRLRLPDRELTQMLTMVGLRDLPTIPVRIEDVPPGWLAWLANIAIIVTAVAAFATIFVPLVVRRLSGARLDVAAERDDATVYVRLANKGGEPLSIRAVFLGVLREFEADGPKNRAFHLEPNSQPAELEPFVLKPGEYKLVQMTWPRGVIKAWTYDPNGNPAYAVVSAADVRLIVRLYMSFENFEIKLEPQTAPR